MVAGRSSGVDLTVYRLTGDSWVYETTLGSCSDLVATDGHTIAIGCPADSANGANSGAVRLFEYNAGLSVWEPLPVLRPATPGAGARFGAQVAIDGDALLVASPGQQAAYFFRRELGAWIQSEKLTRVDRGSYGEIVDIDEGWLLVSGVVTRAAP
jgi:hypothetical protein